MNWQKLGTKRMAGASPRALAENDCVAKTCAGAKGCTVKTHSRAAYFVAKSLLEHYAALLGPRLRLRREDLIAPLLHDLGKLTPAFQQKIHAAYGDNLGLMLEIEAKGFNHAAASKTIVDDEWQLAALAEIVGAHHGAKTNRLGGNACGGQAWQALQKDFAVSLCDRYGVPLQDVAAAAIDGGRGMAVEARGKLVWGLTVLADWLASSLELPPAPEPDDAELERLARGQVRACGFRACAVAPGRDFAALFGFAPYPLQQGMAATPEPGAVYVLETEMGGGKTEAAFWLAYRLLEQGNHGGIYFALPTQLTSDKIYDRFQAFLRRALPAGKERRALLLHGRAWLREDIHGQSDDGVDDGRVRDGWFDGKRRGLLAPFAVGTIDQLLLAVVHARFSCLRALGVAGKVVVIDEIHSYDSYTGTLVRMLIEMLRELNCTVIVLSATLTAAARDKILFPESTAPSQPLLPAPTAYPLLSVRHAGAGRVEHIPLPAPDGAEKRVRVRRQEDAEVCRDEALARAGRGECVLWIDNTVREAQTTFRALAARAPAGVKVGLLHSRFTQAHRHAHEAEWTRLYGKDAKREERAGGKILVGTQVLEQSLDIDADFLVTQLCPMDMLLQRLGRLWRHRAHDAWRPEGAAREAWVLNARPYSPMGKFSEKDEQYAVYAAYVLMRTEEALAGVATINLPADIRPLLEKVYAGRAEEPGTAYARMLRYLEGRRDMLKQAARKSAGTADPAGTDDEGQAPTRYAERNEVEVLLMTDCDWDHGRLKVMGVERWLAIPESVPPADGEARRQWRRQTLALARVLSRAVVRAPEDAAPGWAEFPLERLKHVLYVGDGKYQPLRAALVGAGGFLLDQAGNKVETRDGKKFLRYNDAVGYETVAKRKEER